VEALIGQAYQYNMIYQYKEERRRKKETCRNEASIKTK
jgi:hypothetical protein